MAYLYINTKGTPWRKHSYSAGNDFDASPYKYYLRRIVGWREKDNKARLLFGRALEEAIQFHHEQGEGAVEDFIARWQQHEATELVYTKVEKSWANLNQIGQEMIRLYAIRQPQLPIPLGGQSLFQREFSREVFPGDPEYGEIEDAGKIDIIAWNDPFHLLLPVVEWKPEYGILRPLIVDIKTAAVDFPDFPGIAAHDKQLRRYSWQSGIRDVAILWFKKCGTSLSKGVSVSLLEDASKVGFKPGDEAVVAHIDNERVWIVRNDMYINIMDAQQGRSHNRLDTTKAAKQRKQTWLEQNAAYVPAHYLTRQRVQFNAGRVTDASAEDAGLIPARQIKQIVDARKANQWPNTFGIRFPNDDTRDPYFRAFVLDEKKFREENFTQSKNVVSDIEPDDDPVEEEIR